MRKTPCTYAPFQAFQALTPDSVELIPSFPKVSSGLCDNLGP